MGLFGEIKKLARPYDDDLDDDYEDYNPKSAEKIPVAPQQSAPFRQASPFSSGYDDKSSGNKVVNIHATTQLQVVLVKPDRFESAAEIADHLREKRTVVLNLEQTDKEVSRRLVDFLSGVAYAQDGKIKKVAVSTYIITPYNVDLLGDLIDELENNGLYF
ncbi:MAG: cell division protein SepF [Oscillospiraceae bacterium]|nr:cell division protein SepF [Oscillospiraceae bacterium]